MAAAAVLIADDDPVALELLAEVLTAEGYRVRTARGGEECLRLAAAEPFDLAIVDLRMPGVDGLQVIRRLAAVQPGVPVLILTAFATIDTAIEAVREGAYDYLSKPFRMEEIKLVVRRTLDAKRLARENVQYRNELRDRYGVQSLVGQSPAMVEVYKLVARVARLDTTVLVQGETGTGKELVARAIHYASPRADGPFVVVDCTALPEALFALQAKLLRALQEQAIRRVGGNEWIPVSVRIVAATNHDLRKQVEAGSYREDLYYRLNVVTITLPPLRERLADIPLLAQHLLDKYARASGKPPTGFARETLALLSTYHWPGNVRELENAIERAVALSSSELIMPDDLPAQPREGSAAPLVVPGPRMTLEEVKRWYVGKVLEEAGGNKVRAAEILGIDRGTLYRILKRWAVEGEPEE